MPSTNLLTISPRQAKPASCLASSSEPCAASSSLSALNCSGGRSSEAHYRCRDFRDIHRDTMSRRRPPARLRACPVLRSRREARSWRPPGLPACGAHSDPRGGEPLQDLRPANEVGGAFTCSAVEWGAEGLRHACHGPGPLGWDARSASRLAAWLGSPNYVQPKTSRPRPW